jgi:hypothetical protein
VVRDGALVIAGVLVGALAHAALSDDPAPAAERAASDVDDAPDDEEFVDDHGDEIHEHDEDARVAASASPPAPAREARKAHDDEECPPCESNAEAVDHAMDELITCLGDFSTLLTSGPGEGCLARPVPFSDDVADHHSPEGFKRSLMAAIEETGGAAELQFLDCSELPCIAVLRGDGAAKAVRDAAAMSAQRDDAKPSTSTWTWKRETKAGETLGTDRLEWIGFVPTSLSDEERKNARNRMSRRSNELLESVSEDLDAKFTR